MAAIKHSGGTFEVIVLSSSDDDEKEKKPACQENASASPSLLIPSEQLAERKEPFKSEKISMEGVNGKCHSDDGPHAMSTAEDYISYFITELSPLMKDASELKIVNQIQSISSKCKPTFLQSCKFSDLVRTCVVNAQQDRTNIFLHIKDLYDTMKAYKLQKHSVHNWNTDAASSTVPVVENGASCSDHKDTSQLADPEGQRVTERHIQKLENLLLKIDRRIKKLQEKELTLDDMDDDDSIYILEDRYKKRFVKVWEKLCQLKGRSSHTGRHIERKIHFEGTRYPEINKEIEKFVNKQRIFPDFRDISKIVENSNETSGLCLSATEIQGIAQEAFEDVGMVLKKRRQQDEKDLFGSVLTDQLEGSGDPAKTDPVLREELEKNDRIASTIEQVLSKYAEEERKQHLKAEEVPDDLSDASSVGEDEENARHSEMTSRSSSDKETDDLAQNHSEQSEDEPCAAVKSETTEETHPPKKRRINSDCDDQRDSKSESSQEVIILD